MQSIWILTPKLWLKKHEIIYEFLKYINLCHLAIISEPVQSTDVNRSLKNFLWLKKWHNYSFESENGVIFRNDSHGNDIFHM